VLELDGLGLTPLERVRTIGLTGGIGSGKSTVAGAGRCGACAGRHRRHRPLAHLAGRRRHAGARQAFGDRHDPTPTARSTATACASLVFADPAPSRLEAILHPMIGAEASARPPRAAGDRVVVFDVPLLAESSHWRRIVDRILVVDCDEDTQVRPRDAALGLDPAAVRAVIAQQARRGSAARWPTP
jgi:dephospho-CoA kinase